MTDHWIDEVIKEGQCTTDHFNKLIKETLDPAIKDRVNSRTVKSPAAEHKDNRTGQNALTTGGISIGKRTTPARKPIHKMSHGRSKHAHDESTETQRENAEKEQKTLLSLYDKRIKILESLKMLKVANNKEMIREMAKDPEILAIIKSENDTYLNNVIGE